MVTVQIQRSAKSWVAGVCSGIAKHFDVPVWIVRMAWVLGVICVIPFLFYFVCVVSIPKEGSSESFYKPKILGVCYDLSRTYGTDLSVLRVFACSLALVSFGVVVLIYLGLRFVVAKQPST